jgi:hypothetical protein
MEPETEEQRAAREARLKSLCEPLGLTVEGSMVSLANHPDVPAIDASVIDHNHLVPHLLILARRDGRKEGREGMRAQVRELLDGAQ